MTAALSDSFATLTLTGSSVGQYKPPELDSLRAVRDQIQAYLEQALRHTLRIGPTPSKIIPATHILWIHKDDDKPGGYPIPVHDIWWNLHSAYKLPTKPNRGTISKEGLIDMDFPVKDTHIGLTTFNWLYGVQDWPKSLPEIEAVIQQAKEWGFKPVLENGHHEDESEEAGLVVNGLCLLDTHVFMSRAAEILGELEEPSLP